MSLMRKFVIAAGCAVALVGGSVGVAYAGEYDPSGNATFITERSTAGNYTKQTTRCYPNYGYESRAYAVAGSSQSWSSWLYGGNTVTSAQMNGTTNAAVGGSCSFR
jgi:hypothetical protein